MASQSEIVKKVHKIKKILQINLETEEEHYEVQNESVDLIELLDDETNENHTEVEEKDNANETLFLEKTQSLHKPTIKTVQSNSGDSFLDKTERWSQSFCNETPEPSPEPDSLDSSETLTFFQNKTQSLTRSQSIGTPGLCPVSGLLDDTITLSGNKTVQHNNASVGSYLTSTPARSQCLAQEVASCSESFNNNACPKSPILEYSRSSPHPSEAHLTDLSTTIIEECRPSTSCSTSGDRKTPNQETSLTPVYGSPHGREEMSSQVEQIIDENKFASCPICYKILFKGDLPFHASGCEGEEDGFVGMSEGFLCGYCFVHIKNEDEEMEEHLSMCKAAKTKKRAEAERQGRKKTLIKGSVSKNFHKNVPGKRKEKRKETKTVGRSNPRRSTALVSRIQPVHRQKRISNEKFNPPTSNTTGTNPPTSNATSTIADDCIPSTSKRILTKHSETSRLVKRNLRSNPCQQENIRTGNSNTINQPTDRHNSKGRNLTAPRTNGKARKKARVICSACPLCFKHWMMEELEIHASGCLGGGEEIIRDGSDEAMMDGHDGTDEEMMDCHDGTDEEMDGHDGTDENMDGHDGTDQRMDGHDGTERFLCGYCSMSVQVREADKENHLISCRKKMVMKKWHEAAREKKNALRSREKKQV